MRKFGILILSAAICLLVAATAITVSVKTARAAEDTISVKVLQSFDGRGTGENVMTTNPNQPVTGNNWQEKISPIYIFNATAVTVESRAGFEGSPSVGINSTTEQRHDSGARPMVKITANNRDFTADDCIMFYIRLTNASSQIFPSVRFCNGLAYDGEMWGNLGNRTVRILPYGESTWRELQADGGLIHVDPGFSGFVCFAIGDVKANDGATANYGTHRIDGIAVDADKYGGIYGAFYLDAFYLVKEFADTNKVTDGERVGTLFDFDAGCDDKVFDVFNNLPVGAGLLTGYPAATIDVSVIDVSADDKKVRFTIPETEGITGYKVGIFRNVYTQTGEGRFLLEAYCLTQAGAVELTGLCPDAEHSAIILAMKDGSTEGYLQKSVFRTEKTSEEKENIYAESNENSKSCRKTKASVLFAAVPLLFVARIFGRRRLPL